MDSSCTQGRGLRSRKVAYILRTRFQNWARIWVLFILHNFACSHFDILKGITVGNKQLHSFMEISISNVLQFLKRALAWTLLFFQWKDKRKWTPYTSQIFLLVLVESFLCRYVRYFCGKRKVIGHCTLHIIKRRKNQSIVFWGSTYNRGFLPIKFQEKNQQKIF